jgi:REP element-mobilizing transposase RayT
MTYLITFACYGSHMHGAAEGSVDRSHNRFGAPIILFNSRRLANELNLMDQPPYHLDALRRQALLGALIHRCAQGDWPLLAAHVRSDHVHIVIRGEDSPEFIMTQLKSAISRQLNELGFDDRSRKRWARHGSTRALFNDEAIQQAIRYVIDGQGEYMSIFRS